MKKRYLSLLWLVPFLVTQVSCVKDLDTKPLDKDEVTSSEVYRDPANYENVLAKVYAVLTTSGQQGPAGKPDIGDLDEGMSQFIRQYWNCQELTTDEAVCAWNDGNLRDYHDQDWTSGMEYIGAMYNRIFYLITIANEFIRESTDAKLESRGFSDDWVEKIRMYRAEARTLRALGYYLALDMFGNVPFVTEGNAVGSFMPPQIKRGDLFKWLETELTDLENLLLDPRTNVYGRLDKAFAWTLLAKLYLNAEVYTGVPRYTESIAYSKKIMPHYALHTDYAQLFMADNHTANGIIFAVPFDGLYTHSFGGTSFIIHAAIGGKMNAADFGMNGGWAGNRTTSALVNKFREGDSRGMFFNDGQSLEIDDMFDFKQGYTVTKFTNMTSLGTPGVSSEHADTDFPLFRLADIYLMYAEAIERGGAGGNKQEAVTYINDLRTRAFGNNSNHINTYNLDFLLDERARELYWEGHRRTDLIRFGKFSNTTYAWAWKGGVKAGKAVSSNFDLFPIPSSDIGANTNLVQNPGY